MVELAARAILLIVCVLLGWGVVRQFVVSKAATTALDHLAIVPQWKFFAQQKIDGNPEAFGDFHLLVRTARGEVEPGEWHDLLYYGERRLRHALWNPRYGSRSLIMQNAVMLTWAEAESERAPLPSALSYLTVLRFCLDRTFLEPGEVLQFGVAITCGRAAREPRLRFLSAWHCR